MPEFDPNLHAQTLKDQRAYCIEPSADPAFSPQIGALVEMMIYTRLTTLHAVQGLTPKQLDTIPEGFKNSIGALLAHITAVERIYQSISFKGYDNFEDESYTPYRAGLSMGADAPLPQNKPLDWYLQKLADTRAITLAELAGQDDAWLGSLLTCPSYDNMNHHWAWFHVMEDEVSHRGQIRILRNIIAPLLRQDKL